MLGQPPSALGQRLRLALDFDHLGPRTLTEQAMVDGQWARAYEFLDPYFRARIPVEMHLKRMGIFKFHKFDITKVDYHHSVAGVLLTVATSVPPTTLHDKPYSAPEKDYEFPELWIYVDGNWYRNYVEQGSGWAATKF